MREILRGSVHVHQPPERALHWFTPVGERLWAGEAWDPHFPDGESGDGASPGTVFVTEHGSRQTLWTVIDRADDLVRYARITPGRLAGLVEVRLSPDGHCTRAEVTYDLTALTEEAEAELREFADGYADEMGEWEQNIAAAVDAAREKKS